MLQGNNEKMFEELLRCMLDLILSWTLQIEATLFTKSRYDNAQSDQGLVNVRALRQSIPAVVRICAFTVRHNINIT